ncbi:MAG TPA: hypothetical protein PLD59_05530 [Tepidisphaeraceae bacterium]|nr:hypothetical protein [Tepidisphaeraceae bacterium]
MKMQRVKIAMGLASFAVFYGAAMGQVDNLTIVLPEVATVGGVPSPSPLAAFGYDPVNDRMFVAGFSNGDQELRRVDNPTASSVAFQTQVFATSWLRFNRDNDLNLGGGSPTPSAMLLNPLPINLPGGGTLPAYSMAAITDAGAIVQSGSGATAVRFPEKSNKVYTYNLQQSVGPIATDVFTQRVTIADLQAATGAAVTETSNNIGRQPAWSGDGQSIYFIDTAVPFGGVWKLGAVTGAPVRLLATNTDLNTEPAVIASGGVDSIFFRGGGATGNVGGIDKITHDGTTTSARTVHVPASEIASFFEQPTSDMTSFSMASDGGGNLYFNNTATARRGIFRLDPEGRVVKVLGYEERRANFAPEASPSVNSNTLRMQIRSTTYTGNAGSFAVPQLMYTEASGVNHVAGAYLFRIGDFNRDDVVDQADIGLFKSALTLSSATPLSGIIAADQPKLRFDLNGNNVVSWKDVKILQQFYVFPDGDADMDKSVNLDDFTALAANFGLPGRLWTQGDFTGDELVDLNDFTTLAANFGATSPAGAARGSVPEPTAGALIGALCFMLRLRNRQFA